MKVLAYILISVCLCLGGIAATTAYVPTIESAEAAVREEVRLTLAAGAGVREEDKTKKPLVKKGTVLTADVLAELKANDVRRVRVREFAFGRWEHAWLFWLAVVGLLGGGLFAKREVRREVRARMASPEAQAKSPEAAIAAISQTVDSLHSELSGAADGSASDRIVEVLGDLQRTHMETVVEARPALIERFGLSGYAELMDRYAVLERQINRAWSAAADGVEEEAMICLQNASQLTDAVAQTIQA